MLKTLLNGVDPLALTALGFLAGVIVLSLGLFGWLLLKLRSRPRA